ncbi:hypothetical protein [Inquilinus sp. Marseille-Q2685]|uniref:hypothetical protein n=1 Tax=Inquilinus sp. Marseille-Q2685 TaxID=2866581 RepID=UPI001CE423A8|nr:hypothetical protein [Inquilinus sp. Marseille-Q2685]
MPLYLYKGTTVDPRHTRPRRRRHVRPGIARAASRFFWFFCAVMVLALLLVDLLVGLRAVS